MKEIRHMKAPLTLEKCLVGRIVIIIMSIVKYEMLCIMMSFVLNLYTYESAIYYFVLLGYKPDLEANKYRIKRDPTD